VAVKSVRPDNSPTTATVGAFWDDLARDLQDPDFLRDYVVETVRIATIDAIVNELDEAREAAGLSKAELARAISAEPAVIRRLFSASGVNPTLGTLAEVAAALGMRVALVPLPPPERKTLTEPLLHGHAADTKSLAKHLSQVRTQRRHPALAR
jgi:transcriptional regulator with XRE-family HTH domain